MVDTGSLSNAETRHESEKQCSTEGFHFENLAILYKIKAF